MVKRMGLMSNPAVPVAGNPELLASQQVTRQIADKLIADTTSAIPTAVAAEANAARTAAIRDAAIVAGVMLLVLLLVIVVARSLVRPLRRLRDSALKVAHEDLAEELERVRAGGEPGRRRADPGAHLRRGRSGRTCRRRTPRAGRLPGR